MTVAPNASVPESGEKVNVIGLVPDYMAYLGRAPNETETMSDAAIPE